MRQLLKVCQRIKSYGCRLQYRLNNCFIPFHLVPQCSQGRSRAHCSRTECPMTGKGVYVDHEMGYVTRNATAPLFVANLCKTQFRNIDIVSRCTTQYLSRLPQ